MTADIPDEAITGLIQIGRGDTGESRDELLARSRAWDWINRLHWRDWDTVTERLSENDHETLAKGLVLGEEWSRWSGGSVAAAIWVYRSFERKFPDAAKDLANWMLANSNNPWVPFGSDRGSARSIEQLREFQKAQSERKQRTASSEAARAELKEVKESVRKRMAEYRKRVQRVTSEARAELVGELESLPASARLEHLAWDVEHPLAFYPVSLIAGTEDAWTKAAEETRHALLTRAAAAPRGPWRQWWKQRANCDPINEMTS